MKRVAVPGYSEHGYPEKLAIDFMTIDGSPTERDPFDFEKAIEYEWLVKNAHKFHFYESNPRNNKLGTMYEPWHWQWKE